MKRRISAVLLIFLFVFSTGYSVYSAGTDEGYGEDSEALGQLVDNFENMDWIAVNVSVERNATLNAMELNLAAGSTVIENFTTYIEVDEDNDIIITDPRIAWTSLRRDADSHVYFDYGAGFFGDFEFTFELNISEVEAGDGTSATVTGFSFLANEINSIDDIRNANGQYLGLILAQVAAIDDRFYIHLWQFDGGVQTQARLDDAFGADYVFDLMNFKYYFTFNRSGGNFGAWAYNDSAKTNLIAWKELSGDATTYRYAYGINNYNRAVDGANHHTGNLENWSLMKSAAGYVSSGYFITENYLSDPLANGSTLVEMTNSTIPANTKIRISFSVDNSTWVNNRGVAGFNTLVDGFFSLDLRNLNYSTFYYALFNLSTTNSASTPRIYQSRVITTQGGVLTVGQNVTGEWIEYKASAINASVGIVDGGNLNSTFEIDGDTFNVSEVVGVPGQVISINFTGVDPDAECVWVTIWYLYDGNLNHDFDIEMWNFASSAWVDDGHLVDGVVFDWANSTIYAMRIPNDFLSGGEVRVQLNHESPGNINHDLFIDYIRLIAKIPSDVTAGEEFQFFWIVIAIALMLIGIVLSKMWFDGRDP